MNRRKLHKALLRLRKLPKNRYLILYLLNKLNHFRLKAVRSAKVARPSTVMIELTNQCNLRCTTCPREYDYGKAMDRGYIGMDQAKKIIDELWPYLDSIGLTGMGETMMYKDIEEVVDYIHAKNPGIIISISTNAMLPGFIDRIAPLIGKIDTIQVSIDGLGEVYEKIRLNAGFEMLDQNLRKLAHLCRDTRTDLMLNMVVTKENYHQMAGLVDYAGKTGISYMDFTLFNLASVTDIPASYYRFYKSKEFLRAVDDLEEAIAGKSEVIVTNRNFKTDNGFRKCPFPWTHFYICWDGYITPCCAKPFPKELNFGNVFERGVMKVLNSEGFREFRRMWFRNETPAFCEKCHFIDVEPIG